MFEDEFARERDRQAAELRAAEEHEQHIEQLLAAKDAEIEHLRDAARAFRDLVWAVQDDGALPADRVADLERIEALYDDIDPEDQDGDES